jgi:hydrogenase maturation factor
MTLDPSLAAAAASPAASHRATWGANPVVTRGAGHCVTCGDDGVPMTVLDLDKRRGLALCADAEGARATVETALVEPVALHQRLLVHAGVAIASLPTAALHVPTTTPHVLAPTAATAPPPEREVAR